MCGVSHNALYKHFKNKEAFINEIFDEVWINFRVVLEEVQREYAHDCHTQVLELSKTYITYMLDNPEYMEFMFLSGHSRSIKIEGNKLPIHEDSAFGIFKKSAENYFDTIDLDEELYLSKALQIWGTVHGIATLLVKKVIEYDGDVLNLIESIIDPELIINTKRNK